MMMMMMMMMKSLPRMLISVCMCASQKYTLGLNNKIYTSSGRDRGHLSQKQNERGIHLNDAYASTCANIRLK